MVSTSLLSSQLSFDLVRELPQVGDGLAQIGKLSVDGADVCGGGEGEHHTELLERRFHGFSFDKMTYDGPSAGGYYTTLFSALLVGKGMARLWAWLGAAPFFIEEDGRQYAYFLLADRPVCLLLYQLLKPLSASPRQLPRRPPPHLAHRE